MRSRLPRILLSLFWFVWTTIVIPGHTRGAIQLDPRDDHSCCKTDSPSQKSPAIPSPSNCAICHLAAHLMPAVCLEVRLEPGELLELADLAPSVRPPDSVVSPLNFLSRAPPSLPVCV